MQKIETNLANLSSAAAAWRTVLTIVAGHGVVAQPSRDTEEELRFSIHSNGLSLSWGVGLSVKETFAVVDVTVSKGKEDGIQVNFQQTSGDPKDVHWELVLPCPLEKTYRFDLSDQPGLLAKVKRSLDGGDPIHCLRPDLVFTDLDEAEALVAIDRLIVGFQETRQ